MLWEDDVIMLYDGTPLRTHPRIRCSGYCAVHFPSAHPLLDAPVAYLAEANALFRICEHGAIHPDPDSLAFLATHRVEYAVQPWHRCCPVACCLRRAPRSA